MNLNNIFKKVTGVALAATLSFGAFAGNAFAAQSGTINTQGSSEALTSAPEIKKEVTGGNSFGGGTFSYTIKGVDIPANTYTGYTSRLASDFITIPNDITLASDDREGSTALNIDQNKVNNLVPGVYRFEIKENKSNISGMTDDDSTIVLDAFVTTTNGKDRNVQYFLVSKGGQKTDLKFTNTLSQEDIVINKTITGNQADVSDKFTFEVTVTPANGSTNTSIRYSTDETNFTNVTPNDQGVSIFTLNDVTNNSKITIDGLAANDKITVKETDAENRGYTANVKGGAQASGEVNSTTGVSAEATITQDIADIDWENSKTANTPTGLIENVAPFVLAIAAAGVIFFIYFKNNKKEEELA